MFLNIFSLVPEVKIFVDGRWKQNHLEHSGSEFGQSLGNHRQRHASGHASEPMCGISSRNPARAEKAYVLGCFGNGDEPMANSVQRCRGPTWLIIRGRIEAGKGISN